jgi:serine/threonine protein phosphatase 1
MSIFRRVFGRSTRPEQRADSEFAPLRPGQPVYVIGDIHGRADLLDQLLAVIARDCGDRAATIICVGDYIDRGDQSAAVLARLYALQRAEPTGFHCLMGNHEKMMLDFLDRPEERGARWLRNGGLQTLASFGIGAVTDASGPERIVEIRHALARVLPAHLALWVRNLPLSWQSGNLGVVHAGADPALPFDVQEVQTLIWGHKDFLTTPRTDSLWIVHGHTVTDKPTSFRGRIAVDTGAYYSGHLTAAAIDAAGVVRFLQT